MIFSLVKKLEIEKYLNIFYCLIKLFRWFWVDTIFYLFIEVLFYCFNCSLIDDIILMHHNDIVVNLAFHQTPMTTPVM